jgi:hypothetical protein
MPRYPTKYPPTAFDKFLHWSQSPSGCRGKTNYPVRRLVATEWAQPASHVSVCPLCGYRSACELCCPLSPAVCGCPCAVRHRITRSSQLTAPFVHCRMSSLRLGLTARCPGLNLCPSSATLGACCPLSVRTVVISTASKYVHVNEIPIKFKV